MIHASHEPASLIDWAAFCGTVLAIVVVSEFVRYRREKQERERWREWVREENERRR